jgi:SAM-dependent methyltransferase
MQSMSAYLTGLGRPPRSITDLEIAPNMLAKARARLGENPPFAYRLYAGISVPLSAASRDLIYSVACLQHVPRPYVFNLFFEVHRLLKDSGHAVMHFMSTDCIRHMERVIPWLTEIRNQITGAEAHWCHYYTRQELEAVLAVSGFFFARWR